MGEAILVIMNKYLKCFLGLAILFSAACSDDASVSDGICSSNAQCGGGEVCLAGKCTTVRAGDCESDDHCPGNQYCDLQLSRCVEMSSIACTADLDCRNGQRCDAALALCVECLSARDCDSNLQCVSGQCIDARIDAGIAASDASQNTDGGNPGPDSGPVGECVEDLQCNPPQTVCEANQCVLGCSQSGGLMCGTDEVCDSNTGRCVFVSGPCQMDSECGPPSQVCEGGQCVRGCGQTGGIQCSGGTACNPSTGRCETAISCASDNDCSPPQTICNLRTGNCIPGCLTSACNPPATCNMVTGHCEGSATACVDDGREQNDTRGNANLVGGNNQINLVSCPMDEDFFRISLAQSDTLNVDVDFSHAEGNINIELLDSNGAVERSSNSQTDNESFSYGNGQAQDVFVRVYLDSDAGAMPGNSYRLSTSVTGAPCMSDSYEPNDSIATARGIMTGIHSTLWVCNSDSDYFSFMANAGDALNFDLNYLPNEGDIAASLMSASGNVLASSLSHATGGSLTYTVNSSGIYYLQVYLLSDTGTVNGNAYSLDARIGSTSATCSLDRFEPNDARSAAAPVSNRAYINLFSCSTDDDYYIINVSSGDRITIRLDFSHAEGDIDLWLYEPGGFSAVASSVTITDPEEISSYQTQMSGAYTIKVDQYLDTGNFPGNSYTMSISY